jgi:uncharacterized membrane protein YbaN (DUF454 family)
MSSRFMRALLVVCGTLLVAVGVVGIFLPLLPTTVFLLLAAACYARSSERFYRGLIENRWLGPYIQNHYRGRGLRRRDKAAMLALLWAGIGATMAWSVEAWWLRTLLAAIALGVTVHVVKLPAFRPEALATPAADSRQV